MIGRFHYGGDGRYERKGSSGRNGFFPAINLAVYRPGYIKLEVPKEKSNFDRENVTAVSGLLDTCSEGHLSPEEMKGLFATLKKWLDKGLFWKNQRKDRN